MRLAAAHWLTGAIGRLWLLAVFAFLYMPLVFMLVFSFNSTKQDASFTGFSLRWYEALLLDERLIGGFFVSLKVALMAGVLSTVLGTFVAFVLVRYRNFMGSTLFSGMASAPLVMPEVVIGLSLLLFFVGVQNLLGWPERGMGTIVMGHTLFGLAYAAVVIKSRLEQVDRSLEDAALDLGAHPHQMFFLVTMPNISQALLAAFLLAFTLSFDDVVIAQFLSGPGVSTLPQEVFNYARRGINPTVYAAATVLITTLSLGVIVYGAVLARRL